MHKVLDVCAMVVDVYVGTIDCQIGGILKKQKTTKSSVTLRLRSFGREW